jgi:hypothetical protein
MRSCQVCQFRRRNSVVPCRPKALHDARTVDVLNKIAKHLYHRADLYLPISETLEAVRSDPNLGMSVALRSTAPAVRATTGTAVQRE